VHGGGTPVGIIMKFGIVVETLNVMNHANFHLNLMAGLYVRGTSKIGFAFELYMALATLSFATALASDNCCLTIRILTCAHFFELSAVRLTPKF
jgi:hypothetical protein